MQCSENVADASTTAVDQHKPQDETECTTTDATTSQAICSGMNTDSPSTTTGILDLDLASAQVVTTGSMGLSSPGPLGSSPMEETVG